MGEQNSEQKALRRWSAGGGVSERSEPSRCRPFAKLASWSTTYILLVPGFGLESRQTGRNGRACHAASFQRRGGLFYLVRRARRDPNRSPRSHPPEAASADEIGRKVGVLHGRRQD
ncbi:hypothetical protein GFS60_01585 [Rhodococcus sp. WAY2]|nr:hypothetical protein GFS60_01585 [Rhodococcus sp. WAY2]